MPLLKGDECLDIARGTGVFTLGEIDVLRDVYRDYTDNPLTNYNIFYEFVGESVVGFAIFGKTPLTEYGWDIYWIVVEKGFQGHGIGRKLLGSVESYINSKQEKAVMRVETSARMEYTHARKLYTKQGFKQVGIIPDFYSEGDDLIVFYKETKKQI
ncbi:MAG: N-acetyltransferase [bacterium]